MCVVLRVAMLLLFCCFVVSCWCFVVLLCVFACLLAFLLACLLASLLVCLFVRLFTCSFVHLIDCSLVHSFVRVGVFLWVCFCVCVRLLLRVPVGKRKTKKQPTIVGSPCFAAYPCRLVAGTPSSAFQSPPKVGGQARNAPLFGVGEAKGPNSRSKKGGF